MDRGTVEEPEGAMRRDIRMEERIKKIDTKEKKDAETEGQIGKQTEEWRNEERDARRDGWKDGWGD